jgi:hypothetical protein
MTPNRLGGVSDRQRRAGVAGISDCRSAIRSPRASSDDHPVWALRYQVLARAAANSLARPSIWAIATGFM